MSTEMGEYQDTGKRERGIETRNLRTLLIASAVLGVGSYFWAKTTWGIVVYAKAWWSSI